MGPLDSTCIFCRIVQGTSPSSIVYQTPRVVAFMDAFPVNQGHVLVIPRVHSPLLDGLDVDDGCEVFKAAMIIADRIRRSKIRSDGINLILADGEAAGQEIPHVHLHVIPRYPGDNFSMSSRTRDSPSRRELEEVASKLRSSPTASRV